jgi:CBS domain-containing protein
MRVRDIMTQPATTCVPDTSIAIAANLMEEHDCGVLPVVDGRRRLVGLVTDRDLLLAAAGARRNKSVGTVREAMNTSVATCFPADDLSVAVNKMRTEGVRRLPVVDHDRHVIGLLSIDDVVRWGVQADGLTAAEVVATFEGICERRAARHELNDMKSLV